jgi:nitrogen regulatory protein P-II 1
MKILTLYVHKATKQKILDKISRFEQIKGCYMTSIEGYFEGIGSNPFESKRDLVVGYTPRLKLDIMIETDNIDYLLKKILSCTSCAEGKGIWTIQDLDKWGKL